MAARSLLTAIAAWRSSLVNKLPIGKVLDVVGPWDARGFFAHCGYGGLEQQL
jgi:hypothetical protein